MAYLSDKYRWRHVKFKYKGVSPQGTYDMETTVYFLLIPDAANPMAPKFILWIETRGNATKHGEMTVSFKTVFPTATWDQVYQVYHMQCAFKVLDMWTRTHGAVMVRSNETDYQARRQKDQGTWQDASSVWNTYRSHAEKEDPGAGAYDDGGDRFEFGEFFDAAKDEQNAWQTHNSSASGDANSYRKDWDPAYSTQTQSHPNNRWNTTVNGTDRPFTIDDLRKATETLRQATVDQQRREEAQTRWILRRERDEANRKSRELHAQTLRDRAAKEQADRERAQREHAAANRVFGLPGMYRPLFVTEDAPDEVVKAAYRALAKMYHPDKPTSDEPKMKELNRAWSDIRKERHL